MALATIPTDDIETGRRLREVSEAQVASLVCSIGDVGLLNPITVYPRKLVRGGQEYDGYGLVAGAHRLEAFKRLGLVEIDANIVALSDLERQIAECDENLCAATLTKSERALFTKRRKDAYEALHPETKAGGDRGNQHTGGKSPNWRDATRFTADTAAKTGVAERVVQRDAERGNKISEKALSLVRGSKLDTGSYLDKLKELPKEEQVQHVKSDLANVSAVSQRYKEADKARREQDKAIETVAAEDFARWLHDRCDLSEIAQIVAWLEGAKPKQVIDALHRISSDAPVFDRSAA